MQPDKAVQIKTITGYVESRVRKTPDKTWLREQQSGSLMEWSWKEADEESQAVAVWIESEYGNTGTRFAILSRNRAHWMLADTAIAASGNVSVPIFTTQSVDAAQYILNFSDVRVIFVGESENWEAVSEVVPESVRLVALPGVEIAGPHMRWTDIVQLHAGKRVNHVCQPEDLMSLVFTSGTTGAPKGVMQTHASMLVPMERAKRAFKMRSDPRFLSYLPLAHIAERQLIWIQSLIHGGTVTFNESLPHLVRDMSETKPTYFFGAPRVWEQLQQGILAQFGSQPELDAALSADETSVGTKVRTLLGLMDTDYLLTASAPTPSALIRWYERLGIILMEGYGQTEAMALICNMEGQHKIGSIGKPIEDVDVRIAESGELQCKAEGLSPGYYNMPEKTAETFVDGWVHTGDKARKDADGFYYITGRVKDYFKTIHGKYVSPVSIESSFARNQWVEQQCLLGRGYSKTVMTCVLSAMAQEQERNLVEDSLMSRIGEINDSVEKHARIGAIMIAVSPWTIENGMLTPTLKLRRDEIEAQFGERAMELAHDSAVRDEILIEWGV